MGYLDDLKKQARIVREEQQGSNPQEQQQTAIERVLQLSLRLIYGYLRELTEQLNVVKPDLSVSYDIEGYGRITGLCQGDYMLRIDDPQRTGEVSLAFACGHHDARPRVMRTPDRLAFLKQREYLWRHGLKFDSKLTVTGEGIFLLEPLIPVSLRFLPDLKTRRIRFLIKNLEDLGEASYLIDSHSLKREHLDGIAGLVLRKPNSLEKLIGPLITDNARLRIRQALAEERKQQVRHEAKAAAVFLAEQKAAAERRFPAKLRRAAMIAVDRLTAITNALCKRLRPPAQAVAQRALDGLKRIGSRISARIHNHPFH